MKAIEKQSRVVVGFTQSKMTIAVCQKVELGDRLVCGSMSQTVEKCQSRDLNLAFRGVDRPQNDGQLGTSSET